MKKIAVIGYGGQGAWHCGQILKSDVCELAGTYDIKEDGAVRIHAVTDSFYWFANMTGNGVELIDVQSTSYDDAEDVLKFDNTTAKEIAFCDDTIYLFFGKDNSHYYKLR